METNKNKILVQACWFLLLLLNLSFTGANEASCRAKWKDQRAVFVATNLTLKAVKWATGAHKKFGDACEASPDNCISSTISVHYYHQTLEAKKPGTDKEFRVISDLTTALKCDNATQKCVCAEPGAAGVVVDGMKRCIKTGKIKKGEECIHQSECVKENNKQVHNCIYNPAVIKDACGEVEDMRRICSGAVTLVPTATTFVVLLSTVQASMRFAQDF